MKRRFRRFTRVLGERPVLTSFAVALVVRLITAAAINLFHEGVLIPDEGQYLTLALLASEGELTADFLLGYGRSLFDSTRTFMWPLTALFWLFGPYRFVAQLLPVLFGAVTAAAAAGIAGRVLRRSYALTAGLIVALFPSQVLWSSVVLRESLVWAVLAGIALVVGYSQRYDSDVRIIGSALMAGLLILALSWLRDQTAVLALWCLFPAMLIGRGHRAVRVLAAVCVLVVAPWLVGMGPGATTFAEEAGSRMGSAHAYLSIDADSSFLASVPTTVPTTGLASVPTTGLASVPTTGLASVPTTGRSSSVDSFGSFQTMSVADCAARSEKTVTETREIGGVSRALHERERGNRVCIHNGLGGAILVDNRLGTSLSRIPTGIFNTMVRPLPWEATWSNPDKHAAGLESPLWIVLYGLSIYGVWKHRCRLQQMVFPLLLIGAVAILGAMTHGNLGTAFRHRGQILFAFAVLAAGGLQAIADKRSSRRNGRGIADSIDDASRNQVTNPDLPDCAGT